MPHSDGHGDYDYALRVLASGDEAQLKELEQLLEEFPHGEDDFLGRRWIINAVDCGSAASVRWLLTRGVDLRFRDDEGYTVLHSALDRKAPERYELLELLLDAGADPDAKGLNDWTPAHLAAVREDLDALRILVAHGADLSVRTNIDNYATPLEEARRLRKLRAVEFLESIGKSEKGRRR